MSKGISHIIHPTLSIDQCSSPSLLLQHLPHLRKQPLHPLMPRTKLGSQPWPLHSLTRHIESLSKSCDLPQNKLRIQLLLLNIPTATPSPTISYLRGYRLTSGSGFPVSKQQPEWFGQKKSDQVPPPLKILQWLPSPWGKGWILVIPLGMGSIHLWGSAATFLTGPRPVTGTHHSLSPDIPGLSPSPPSGVCANVTFSEARDLPVWSCSFYLLSSAHSIFRHWAFQSDILSTWQLIWSRAALQRPGGLPCVSVTIPRS